MMYNVDWFIFLKIRKIILVKRGENMRFKKITTGALSVMTTITPLVAVVACDVKVDIEVWSFSVEVPIAKTDKESIGSQLKLLPLDQQDSQFINALTQQSTSGKRELIQFTKDTLKQAIKTANSTSTTLMFKVTFSDAVLKLVQEEIKKTLDKYPSNKHYKGKKDLELQMRDSWGFEANFFEHLIDATNTKDKMASLANAINELEKDKKTDFRIVMQLVLPKWLEDFNTVKITTPYSSTPQTDPTKYYVAQIQSVINAKDANINLIALNVSKTGIKDFDISNLPKSLKSLNLSNNQLPQSVKEEIKSKLQNKIYLHI